MKQLKSALFVAGKKQVEEKQIRRSETPLFVEFNAWRHDQDEALWAAFALEFVQQVADGLPPRSRWLGHLKLLAKRFNWRLGWLDLARVVLLTLLVIALSLAIPAIAHIKGPEFIELLLKPADVGAAGQVLATAGGSVASLALLFTLAIRLRNFLSNPLKINLAQYMRSPKYEDRVSFVEQFHKDFQRILKAYIGNRKVFVFIDDLDRADLPTAADLMKALNLMIADEHPLIFIIGLDRGKVAAGIAVKHEKLLPYLFANASPNGSDPSSTNRKEIQNGLEYGYDFIEKFIQLPFLVPRLGGDDLENYLEFLARVKSDPRSNLAYRKSRS